MLTVKKHDILIYCCRSEQQISGTAVRGASAACSSSTTGSSLYSSTPSVKPATAAVQSTAAYKHNNSINFQHYDLESNLDHRSVQYVKKFKSQAYSV